MLIELAIGDAYDAGFEYADEMSANNDLSRYVKHPRHRLIPGSYTDDTQMSIAIAQVIVSQAPWTPQVLADSFVTSFKRDRTEGYAGGFYNFLVKLWMSVPDDIEAFAKDINPKPNKPASRIGEIGCWLVIKLAVIRLS